MEVSNHSFAMEQAFRLMRRKRCKACDAVLIKIYRYRVFRPLVRRLLDRFDGSYMLSPVYRQIFRHYENIELGLFSRGYGLKPGTLPRGTRVGHFSCFGKGLLVLRRNHSFHRFSQHPFFFNHKFGLLLRDSIGEIADNPLQIGSDVWLGMNVTICPGCHRIGNGAIIGAGSVVTKDVPPYTIVAGNPAKLIRKRYAPEVEAVVAASAWWLRPLPELVGHLDLFTQDITETTLARFAAAFPARPKADGAQS